MKLVKFLTPLKKFDHAGMKAILIIIYTEILRPQKNRRAQQAKSKVTFHFHILHLIMCPYFTFDKHEL
jgi:hypothetical protein